MTAKTWQLVSRVAVLFAVVPVAVFAQALAIEAESYTAFNDAGGTSIQKVILSGCSGGYIIIGLDSPGEWTQYDVSPGGFGYYSLVLTGRGDFGREYRLRLVFTPTGSGSVQTVEFSFTGQGYG